MKCNKSALTVAGLTAAAVLAAVGASIKIQKERRKYSNVELDDIGDYTLCKTKPVVIFLSSAKLERNDNEDMIDMSVMLSPNSKGTYILDTHNPDFHEEYSGEDTVVLHCPYEGFGTSVFSVLNKREAFNIFNGLGKYCTVKQVFIVTHGDFDTWVQLNIRNSKRYTEKDIAPLRESIDGFITSSGERNEDGETSFKICPVEDFNIEADFLTQEEVVDYYLRLIKNTLQSRGLCE